MIPFLFLAQSSGDAGETIVRSLRDSGQLATAADHVVVTAEELSASVRRLPHRFLKDYAPAAW